jgi:HemX protein
MPMGSQNWIYDGMIYMYAMSILLYFANFFNPNQKAKRLAFTLLTGVWVVQTAFFINEAFDKRYLPLLTQFETLFFYSWALLTLSLFINWYFRVDLLVIFANLASFAVLVIGMFLKNGGATSVELSLTSDILFIHIVLAVFSYVLFSLSVIFSIFYLVMIHLLKVKKWKSWMRVVPGLEQLDRTSYLLNMIGFPTLLMGLILGSIWAAIKVETNFWVDPKVLTSFLVLFVYGGYLFQRYKRGWQGTHLAWWNVIAFVVVIVNYVISSSIMSFHNWFA